MSPNIIFSNQEEFQKKLSLIIKGGSQHLHIIADFDRTLTRAFVNGEFRASLESVLEKEGHLGSDYTAKAKINFDKYHPMEINPNLPLQSKKLAMLGWRTSQFQLMIEAGISKNIIQEAMKSDTIVFREGYEVFFDISNQYQIPLIIFSASGLGYDAIHYCLQHNHKLYPNISIIANSFIRDTNGKAISIRQPIIHSFNKDETIIQQLPIYDEIKHRKNIILLGDSLGDVGMAKGFDYKNIIKIGFLNKEIEKTLTAYQSVFDVVITNDGSLDFANDLLQKIL